MLRTLYAVRQRAGGFLTLKVLPSLRIDESEEFRLFYFESLNLLLLTADLNRRRWEEPEFLRLN